jgi:hypothetical protein
MLAMLPTFAFVNEMQIHWRSRWELKSLSLILIFSICTLDAFSNVTPVLCLPQVLRVLRLVTNPGLYINCVAEYLG